MTKFANFIVSNVDVVVDEFETFARTSGPAAANLESVELRDHARLVMKAVAADMATPEPASARDTKAHGRAENRFFSEVMKSSRMHAEHRFEQGFTLPQMVSEYRALRASVIRLWTAQLTPADGAAELEELTRFGEAIDEGLTEAIAWYSKRLEASRTLLIGIMAHDLRTPLGAVRMSAEYLLKGDRLQDGDLRAAARIVTSSARMASIVSDLLDFTQTLLGAGLPLTRARVDLALLCEDVVDELRVAHPNAQICLDVRDVCQGSWDAPRLSQLLSNLVTNAIIHGDMAQPATVALSAIDDAACLSVHNWGEPISISALPNLFRPLSQSTTATRSPDGSSGLNLGLYIAREIAIAHGGVLEVSSTKEAGTTFTVRLPLA